MTPRPRREHPAGTLTIQEAVTETVQRSYGPDGSHIPPKAMAQDMNLALSVLYDIADERRPRQLRAAELPALVRASGNPLVLTVIARAVGGVFVPLPAVERPGELGRLLAATVREFGEWLQEVAASETDARWTREQYARTEQEWNEAVAAGQAVLARAKARMDASEPSSAFRAVGGTAS